MASPAEYRAGIGVSVGLLARFGRGQDELEQELGERRILAAGEEADQVQGAGGAYRAVGLRVALEDSGQGSRGSRRLEEPRIGTELAGKVAKAQDCAQRRLGL